MVMILNHMKMDFQEYIIQVINLNYYKTLGLKEGASQAEIKAAYNSLSKKLNPANNDN